MKFTTRNLYYLRLSAGAIIPLYVYLDERHVPWMSERVLQHVLADLRPLITTKLIAEENANLGPGGSTNAKKGTVDVHRGDTYQFGYFLRNTDPHAVLIKTRRFTAAPKALNPTRFPLPQNDITTDKKVGRKRGRKAASDAKPQKSVKGKGRAKQVPSDIVEEAEFFGSEESTGDVPDGDEGVAIRRSTRKRRVAAESYAEGDEVEADMDEAQFSSDKVVLTDQAADETGQNSGEEGNLPALPEEDTLMVEEEEEKPKPVLQLRYQGFSVHGRCLCVIVEPYPPIRQQRQMSLAPSGVLAPRATSIAPAPQDFIPSGAASRSKTPLFLPDDDGDDYGRGATPAPTHQHSRPPVPLFDETPGETEKDADEEDNGGMMAFSQVLHTMGDHYTGAADDDDEMEGMVLFGDADEIRGLS